MSGAELWLGIDTTVNPLGTLCLAVDLLAPPGRASAESSATVDPAASPMLRWEAMATHGPAELALDFDGTRGLQRGGVVGFRVPDLDWAPRLRPGQATGTSYRWLRARLVTASYPTATRLAGMVLNGVTAGAARSVRGEVAEAVDRSASGSRYRLATVPVVPGSVELEITGSAAGLGVADPTGSWAEVPTLSTAQPDDQVFVLDPASGVLTFGDGLHGRSVPEGYRNVVSLVYRTGGGTTGHAATGDLVPPEVSIPDLTGLRVVSISTGSDAEDATGLLRRGPAVIRSRERAVAATDYAVAALGTPGAAIARAHCLPAVDSTGTPSPGALGLVVVPRLAIGSPGPPVPDVPTLQLVADHLALEAGVVGAHVLALAPTYRRVAVQCLLVGALGADLAGLVSTARDRLDAWLDPLVGGDGAGWEFGAPVQWNDVVRMLLARVPRLEAVSQVSFRVDGRALPACTDVVLAPGELVWPSTHLLEVAPEVRGGAA